MKVLIIDDSEYKYTQIKDSLDRLGGPWITWEKSRNSGLVSVLKHNVQKKFDPFDLIITDNILPIYDGEKELEPFAKDIVNEIRRMGLEDLPIVVCSSDDIEECDCNYIIKYNVNVSLDGILQVILGDIAANKKIKEQEEIRDCKSCQNMSCRVETYEKPVENCLGYIHHKEKLNKANVNYTSVGNLQEQGLVKKLIK